MGDDGSAPREVSISAVEERVLDRLVAALQGALGPRLEAIWLFGSRARGEPSGPESDIDLLLVVDGDQNVNQDRVIDLVWEAALTEGADPLTFSAKVRTPEHIAQRREIDSFFMREVDRDKIVLAGGP